MTERCPFCNEPAIREHVSGFSFRCGTYGPDSKGEYATGHTCDIATYNRLLKDKDCEINRLKNTCRAVLASLERADLNGVVLWIRPPYQQEHVHMTAQECLLAAIDDKEDSND